jgi:hypothetical protein
MLMQISFICHYAYVILTCFNFMPTIQKEALIFFDEIHNDTLSRLLTSQKSTLAALDV